MFSVDGTSELSAYLLPLISVIASFASFLTCYIATSYLIKFLTKKKMMVLDYHKHDKPQVPRPGGPALIAAIVAGELILFLASGSYAVFGLTLVTLVSGFIGLVDDLHTLGGVTKPLLLLFAGVPLFALQEISGQNPVYNVQLYLPLFHTPTNLPILYPLLILAAIPITTNTINTIDVLNGVVSGIVLIALIPVAIAIFLRVEIGKSNPIVLLAVLPIIASVGAFYMFHRYPSKIFPGDSGSLALGGAYGALSIIGGVEFVALVAILPAILNSFFFLSSVKRLVEHRQVKSNPTVTLPDARIVASDDPKAPITLMRLLVAFQPFKEKEVVLDIFRVAAFCAVLAVLTALLTWVITIG